MKMESAMLNRDVLFQPLEVFFAACMKGLMPLRRRGLFGTPDAPRVFMADEPIPWWIECRWPMNASLTFGSDVETYYENGWQVVRPLSYLSGAEALMRVDGAMDFLIVGAPTSFDTTPRARRPVKTSVSSAVEECCGLAAMKA
jgi:hypothetical protein